MRVIRNNAFESVASLKDQTGEDAKTVLRMGAIKAIGAIDAIDAIDAKADVGCQIRDPRCVMRAMKAMETIGAIDAKADVRCRIRDSRCVMKAIFHSKFDRPPLLPLKDELPNLEEGHCYS